MNIKFCHLVHFTQDPHQVVAELQGHGLHAVKGGRHENWGTYNGLSYFDLSYIELLGVENFSLAKTVERNGLISQVVEEFQWGDGLARIGLRTENIDLVYRNLRNKGLQVDEPVQGSRQRTDGSVLRWSMLFVKEQDSSNLRFPFFVQWEQSEQERRADLQKVGVIAKHPQGELRLAYVACAVGNLEERIQQWQTWFDFEVGEAFEDRELRATCQEVKIEGGNIIFCTPTGAGIVSETLANVGERPFLVALEGAKKPCQVEVAGGLYKFY